jgi:hypothetical protein
MVRGSWFTDERPRVEIPNKIKMDVFKRVFELTKTPRCPEGNVMAMQCEKCGLVVGKKAQYDHAHPEVFNNMHPNERPPITAADVKRLGTECCHKVKSAGEVKARAKTERLARGEAGLSPKKRGGWGDPSLKKKVGGGVVRRDR